MITFGEYLLNSLSREELEWLIEWCREEKRADEEKLRKVRKV